MNMYVSNLSFHTTNEDLKSLFAEFGEVSSAKIINDKVSGRSRGFGFVEMSDDAAARKAMEALEGREIEGRSLSVAVAREKEERSGNSFSGGGGGNRNFKKW
ncbi:MAG TPA: RNA-binding protein [Chitinophagaceae bacterium]|jgi:RNA recognition motif-containing protein